MKLLFELTRDANISVPNLSKKLGINASVLYSRIKRLSKKKLIKKYTIVIDDSLLGFGVKATVGINRDPKSKEQIHKALLETPEIASISEVTGRFDILVRVLAQNLEALHSVVIPYPNDPWCIPWKLNVSRKSWGDAKYIKWSDRPQ